MFEGHLLMWPLKSGRLHIVLFTNFLLFSCIPFFITILNFCIILLMYMLNNTGERPHPCLTFLFIYTIIKFNSNLRISVDTFYGI